MLVSSPIIKFWMFIIYSRDLILGLKIAPGDLCSNVKSFEGVTIFDLVLGPSLETTDLALELLNESRMFFLKKRGLTLGEYTLSCR